MKFLSVGSRGSGRFVDRTGREGFNSGHRMSSVEEAEGRRVKMLKMWWVEILSRRGRESK